MPEPKPATTDFEAILDRIERFFKKIDTKKLASALRIILRLTILIFPRVVPMKDDERDDFDAITGGIGDALKEISP